jgi:hypothetical protein
MNTPSYAQLGVIENGSSTSDMIGKRLAELEGLASSLEVGIDRFFGSVPSQQGTAGNPQAVPNGLHDEWDSRLRSLVSRLSELAGRMG